MTGRRTVAAVALVAALAGACTSSGPAQTTRTPVHASVRPSTATGTPDAASDDTDALLGPSASKALAKLCPRRALAGSDVPAEGSVPPVVHKVEGQVEQLRGLDFTGRVPVDAVTHAELVRGLEQTFDVAYPAELYERKSRAWATIGAIDEGTEIRQQLETFASTQVVGYYDEVSNYLVFLGTDDPTPAQLVTLAHELTHALDDQHFGLLQLDKLAADCDDEGFEAALALAEGDATYVMVQYARKYLSLEEQLGAAEGGSSTRGIEPFILRLETWPYTAGMAFVQSLVSTGGERAVDAAFRRLPATTEQILDPSRYPNDGPEAVDVPQLAPELGSGWRDLDVQGAGAAWLSILLGLRLDQSRASAAVEGWEAGLYRAWSNGSNVAVVLRTRWQDAAAASRFADAMRDWVAAGEGSAEVEPRDGTGVSVLFGSNANVVSSLRSAV